MSYVIEIRKYVEVNIDPQRRCYDGCHFSSEIQALPWEAIEWGVRQEHLEDRLKFWRELNEYAVSQRGAGARAECRVRGSLPQKRGSSAADALAKFTNPEN